MRVRGENARDGSPRSRGQWVNPALHARDDVGGCNEASSLEWLLQRSGLGYWRHELETDRLTCSDGFKAMCGLDPTDELTSFDQVMAFLPADERSIVENVRQRVLEGADEVEMEHRLVSREGAVRWVMARGRVARCSEVGAVLAGVLIDITAQKEAVAERDRLIAELAAERARLRALVEHLPAAVLMAEVSGNIILANPAVETVFPLPHPEFPTTSADLFDAWHARHPDGRPVEPEERPISRALRGETVDGEDFAYRREDGTESWLRIAGAPIRDADSTITGAVIIAASVDREKRAEEALRTSERRHRQLFDSPVIGIIYSHLDGRITDANDTFLQSLGYTREDLALGRLSWRQLTPPEYRELDDRGVEELITTGSHRVFEKEYLRKDGSRVPIVLGGTLFGSESTEIATFVLDISDRKRVEAERESLLRSLALSEERYRLAAMATDDAIYDWDLATNRVNYQTRLGYPRDTGTSACWAESIHPDDREAALASVRAALTSTSRQWRFEYRYRGANGEWLMIEDRGYVVCDDGGVPVRVVGAMQNVTASRRQQEFERQLIGIVSHDLRNPLATILLASEMMVRSEEHPSRTQKNAQRIHSAAQRGLRMVRDLLDFTRARLGVGISLDRKPVDLGVVVRTSVDEVRVAHRTRKIALDASGDCTGAFDSDRLTQVVTNLVENAIKYSPDGSEVRVTLRCDAENVRLAVHNDGPPIPKNLLVRIFEPLQRGDPTFDPTSRSIGLGLYIVKHLVEAHGGRIEVESADGSGTTFTCELPRAPDASNLPG